MRTRFVVLLGCSAVAAAVGCSAVLGVDFGDAHPKSDALTGDGGFQSDVRVQVDPNDEAGIGEVPDVKPSTCAADEKTCNGVCVKKSDPLHGCGGQACAPCSLTNASEAKCDVNGACVVGKCATDHADCNTKPDDGCEFLGSAMGSRRLASSPSAVASSSGRPKNCSSVFRLIGKSKS